MRGENEKAAITDVKLVARERASTPFNEKGLFR
jgi:hypothetical protein